MANNIYHSFQIKASTKDVFNAITKPEHLNNWWTLKSSGKPELDSIYNLNFTDTYNWFGKVSKVKDNELFYLKMTTSDADWNPTTFGFQLEANQKGTMVRFSHKDWPYENDHFKHWAIENLVHYFYFRVMLSTC